MSVLVRAVKGAGPVGQMSLQEEEVNGSPVSATVKTWRGDVPELWRELSPGKNWIAPFPVSRL